MQIRNITYSSPTNLNKKLKQNVYFKASPDEHFSQGAKYSATQGTKFTIQAPLAHKVSLLIAKNDDYKHIEMYPLYKQGENFSGIIKNLKTGDKYKYVVQKDNGDYFYCYDPRADFLPNDIDGFKPNSEWAEIIDHKQFNWTDEEWMKNRAIKDNRGWHLPDDTILETVHIGLLGGFKNAKKEIDNIVKKGIANTIRIMPIGEFYGDINWGYDEVAKFAPENTYGRPEDLKEFINYAHKNNIRVILDVVLNHFGTIGCVAHKLMPIFGNDTDWGKGLIFNGENSKYTKSYMTDMLMNWAINYHIDGFRLDATHKIDENLRTDTAIQEINKDLKSHKETEDVILYAEDMRISRILANENQSKVIHQKNWGLNGITDFDFYKCLMSLATGQLYEGIDGNISLLNHLYRNGIKESHEEHALKASGTVQEYRDFCRDNLSYNNSSAKNLLVNLSNHDEIGNQGGGKRNLLNILFSRLDMSSRANSWEESQKLLFEMTKYYLQTGEPMPEYKQKEIGCTRTIDEKTFKGEFNASFSLNKLMIGATLLNLSPKEFFMGDDECELAPFKFFANYKKEKITNLITKEKGYRPDYTAFEDSKMHQCFSNERFRQKTISFSKDIVNLIKKYHLQTECTKDNLQTYEHKQANILELKFKNQSGQKIIAVMNFSGKPQDNFTLRTISGEANLKEIINSNSEQYGGSNWNINSYNNNLKAQKVMLPPHSIVVFEIK